MTQLEVAYRYLAPLDQAIMRALDNLRDVYGVRRITLNEKSESFASNSTLRDSRSR